MPIDRFQFLRSLYIRRTIDPSCRQDVIAHDVTPGFAIIFFLPLSFEISRSRFGTGKNGSPRSRERCEGSVSPEISRISHLDRLDTLERTDEGAKDKISSLSLVLIGLYIVIVTSITFLSFFFSRQQKSTKIDCVRATSASALDSRARVPLFHDTKIRGCIYSISRDSTIPRLRAIVTRPFVMGVSRYQWIHEVVWPRQINGGED